MAAAGGVDSRRRASAERDSRRWRWTRAEQRGQTSASAGRSCPQSGQARVLAASMWDWTGGGGGGGGQGGKETTWDGYEVLGSAVATCEHVGGRRRWGAGLQGQ